MGPTPSSFDSELFIYLLMAEQVTPKYSPKSLPFVATNLLVGIIFFFFTTTKAKVYATNGLQYCGAKIATKSNIYES